MCGMKSRGAFGTGHRDSCPGCFLCQKEVRMSKCLYCRRSIHSGSYCSKRCMEAGIDDIPRESPLCEEE